MYWQIENEKDVKIKSKIIQIMINVIRYPQNDWFLQLKPYPLLCFCTKSTKKYKKNSQCSSGARADPGAKTISTPTDLNFSICPISHDQSPLPYTPSACANRSLGAQSRGIKINCFRPNCSNIALIGSYRPTLGVR